MDGEIGIVKEWFQIRCRHQGQLPEGDRLLLSRGYVTANSHLFLRGERQTNGMLSDRMLQELQTENCALRSGKIPILVNTREQTVPFDD